MDNLFRSLVESENEDHINIIWEAVSSQIVWEPEALSF